MHPMQNSPTTSNQQPATRRIALTGARGLVGSRVMEILAEHGHTCVGISSEDVDITDASSVNTYFEALEADTVIHLAAYTNVDGAENEPDVAKKINVDGTKHVYAAAHKNNMRMIHISTDFVFDGTQPPYDETSTPHPLGVYAQTKYEAEQTLIHDNTLVSDAMIVRITYPYRLDEFPKKDFVRAIKGLLEQGKSVAGITDSLITPTYIDDIGLALNHLVTHFQSEVIHIIGSESLSPREAFLLIARKWGLDESLVGSVTFAEFFAGKAPRPQYQQTVSVKNTFQLMRRFTQVMTGE